MANHSQKSDKSCMNSATTERQPEKDKFFSEPKDKDNEKDGPVLRSVETKKSVEATPEKKEEEEGKEDDSPFALQSFLDVPDFEFLGTDGSYQQPFM